MFKKFLKVIVWFMLKGGTKNTRIFYLRKMKIKIHGKISQLVILIKRFNKMLFRQVKGRKMKVQGFLKINHILNDCFQAWKSKNLGLITMDLSLYIFLWLLSSFFHPMRNIHLVKHNFNIWKMKILFSRLSFLLLSLLL